MAGLLDDPYANPASGPGLLGPAIAPLQIAQPDPDTDQGAALAETYRRVMAEMERQQQISADRGLWHGGSLLEGGLPTGAGVVDAANQTAQGILFGTTAPGEAPGVNLRVSTRVPTAVGTDSAAVHAGNDLQIGTDSILGTTAEPKVAAKLQGYPDVLPAQPGQDNATTLQAATDHFAGNLRWIYDNMHPEVRTQAAGWYDGAHGLTRDLADQYGVPHEAVAGMTARLSPGTDWYQNVAMTRRMLDIHHNQADSLLSEPQSGLIQTYIDGQKKPAVQTMMQNEFDAMAGKPYSQLDSDLQRALFIRSHDEAATAADPANAYYNMIHPGGYELGPATMADKVTPTSLGWQSLENIGKAMKILRNPERANISEQLGDAHKIRSFYNNIIEPNAPHGDVTVDTHQIAASHLLPIGISDPVVELGMSGPPYTAQTGASGLYGVYADATRQATEQINRDYGLNLLPRQVQSITWEGARGLFPAAFKRSKTDKVSQPDIFRQIWSNSPDAAAARETIGARRGVTSSGDAPARIPAPDWFQPGS